MLRQCFQWHGTLFTRKLILFLEGGVSAVAKPNKQDGSDKEEGISCHI
jgi:hypothetical protein